MKKRTILTIISFVLSLVVTACNGAADNGNYHVVTFDTNGGSEIAPQKVKHGEKIEKPADPTRKYATFDKWTYKGEEWSFLGYTVTEDMTLLATWIPVSQIGKTVEYGLYPQTLVSDSALINSLNSLTSPASNGWYLYNEKYYAKTSGNPFSSSITFEDGTAIVSGETYWFKCEPITWQIIFEKALQYEFTLLSTVVLDAHRYDASSNNYKNSEIRNWLTHEFYNSAFSLEKSAILTTTVDNSALTTGIENNQFACENTEDDVFLLSYQDYKGLDKSTIFCKPTDWARARGSGYMLTEQYKYSTIYYTRSPDGNDSNRAWAVDATGNSVNRVDYADIGVRPAINVIMD